MKLPQFLKDEDDEADHPIAPPFLIWVPPHGAAVECPSAEMAQHAATRFSSRHPGSTVAVYQLIGYAFAPVIEPEFTPADRTPRATELIAEDSTDRHNTADAEPIDEAAELRGDLNAEQERTRALLRSFASGKPAEPDAEKGEDV